MKHRESHVNPSWFKYDPNMIPTAIAVMPSDQIGVFWLMFNARLRGTELPLDLNACARLLRRHHAEFKRIVPALLEAGIVATTRSGFVVPMAETIRYSTYGSIRRIDTGEPTYVDVEQNQTQADCSASAVDVQ